MRAWIHHRFGPFREVLRLEEVPSPPPPGAGMCRVVMSAWGLNFPDVLQVEGRYQVRPPLPATPGMEGVGVVTDAGPGSRFRQGERVLVAPVSGVFAEALTTSDAWLFRLPPHMPDREAAGFHVTYQTALTGLQHRAGLGPGQSLLVLGAGGGVGTAAVQVGKALGARVLAATAGAEKTALSRACGADAVLDTSRGALIQQVLEQTQGRGVDVVFDPVGGAAFETGLKALALEGRLLVVGFASGAIPSVATNRLLLRNVAVVGLNWGTYRRERPAHVERCHEVLCALSEQGLVRPRVFEPPFEFDQLPDAMAALMARRTWGKVVLSVAPKGTNSTHTTDTVKPAPSDP